MLIQIGMLLFTRILGSHAAENRSLTIQTEPVPENLIGLEKACRIGTGFTKPTNKGVILMRFQALD
jgi:hypothetical protein